MNLFTRHIDEDEDDSRFPRGVLIGMIAAGIAATCGLALFAVGLLLHSTDSRSATLAEYPNTPALGSRAAGTSGGQDASAAPSSPPAWRVLPDRQRVPKPAAVQPRGSIVLTPIEKLVFAPSPSALVAAAGPEPSTYPYHVWDLATAEEVGMIRGADRLVAPLALSPNGTLLAGKVPSTTSTIVNIISVANAQPASHPTQRMAPDAYRGNLDFLAFIDDKHVLAVIRGASEQTAHVWRIADGTLCGRFLVGEHPGIAALSLSPGGQFLAVISGNSLTIHQLNNGAIVGRIDLTRHHGQGGQKSKGLAFSPDMTELAAYCEGEFTSRIVVWSLATGDQLMEHVYSNQWVAEAARVRASAISVIEWLSGGDGWLVLGCLVIGRDRGDHLWTAPRSDPAAAFVSARVLGPDYLAVVEDKKGSRRIGAVRIPRAQ